MSRLRGAYAARRVMRRGRCSRCHPLRAAIPPLGKEIGELVADDLHLTEHEVTSRFEADKPRVRDALGRALTRPAWAATVAFDGRLEPR
jgi:hypothetical protein